jgi:hypothetical protein
MTWGTMYIICALHIFCLYVHYTYFAYSLIHIDTYVQMNIYSYIYIKIMNYIIEIPVLSNKNHSKCMYTDMYIRI